MLIESVTPEEYDQIFPAGVQHIYNSAAFATLNSGKCGSVRYVLFRDSKVRFGLILGERDGVLHSLFQLPSVASATIACRLSRRLMKRWSFYAVTAAVKGWRLRLFCP